MPSPNSPPDLLAAVEHALEVPHLASPDAVAALQLWAGEVALGDGDLESAGLHAKAAAAAATSAENRVRAGRLLLRLATGLRAEPESARPLLELAAALVPAEGLRQLARHLRRSGRAREAAAAWEELGRRGDADGSARLELARCLEEAGEPAAALAAYLQLTEAEPTSRNLLVAADHISRLAGRAGGEGGPVLKIALLGNATLDLLAAAVTVEGHRAGLMPEVYVGGFDQYAQEILDPQSGLHRFQPDVVILAVHPSRLLPQLHGFPFDLPVGERRAALEAGLEGVRSLLDTLTGRTGAMILLHNLSTPQHPALGVYDLRDELGQGALFAEANRRLAELARDSYRNVYVVDEDRVQARSGKRSATDQRLWLTSSVPWSDPVTFALAREYMRFLRPYRGLARKCIVVDLDNTLWGGVLGEDGPDGIQLGPDAPGNAYLALQIELDKLWRRGILLAVASKNDPEPVREVLEKHPAMVLRGAHFAALRINWQEKAENLKEIAIELNIGLDSLVFLDDNPVERARVRAALPMVLTPDLPGDPALYRGLLLELGVFDSLVLTDEDRRRTTQYAEERSRRELESDVLRSGSLDQYLGELAIVVEIGLAGEAQLPRIAQLSGKTNQMNVTTRRRSEADLVALQAAGSRIYWVSVRDRFGDCGLVGVAIVREEGRTWHIDDLLLSCRAMSRGVETALLRKIAADATDAGATELEGLFIPTAKNAPARTVYEANGFSLAGEAEGGATSWRLDLSRPELEPPTWLMVKTAPLLVTT